MDDLRRLRVLREFRERKTITATADALHLTTSAVSQQLAGLSRDLGFAVIEREGRHVVLTERGRILLDHADTVFAQIERARQALNASGDAVRGTVTIGAFSTAVIGLLPQVIDNARRHAPQLSIRIRESDPPAIFDDLDAGRLDVAIAVNFDGAPGAGDPRYHQLPLGTDPLDIALPASHPMATAPQVELLDLRADPWITGCSPSGCCAVITAAACASAGFAPKVAHQVDDWHAVCQLVAHGHGVALVPRMAQRDLPRDLAIRPVAGSSPQRHLFAAVRAGAHDSPLLATTLQLLTAAST